MPAVYCIHGLPTFALLGEGAPLELSFSDEVYILSILLRYLLNNPWIRPLENMLAPVLLLYYGLSTPLLEDLLFPGYDPLLPSFVISDVVVFVKSCVTVAGN